MKYNGGIDIKPSPSAMRATKKEEELAYHDETMPSHTNPTSITVLFLDFGYFEMIVNPIKIEITTNIRLNTPLRI